MKLKNTTASVVDLVALGKSFNETLQENEMDRLAAFYHWRDRQSLDQALLVARNHPIKIKTVEKWSKSEGEESKFNEFLDKLNEIKRKKKRTLHSP